MRVAVLGRTKMLYDAIECLKKAGHEIALIGTCQAAPEYDVTEIDFEKKAKELSVPFFCHANINTPEMMETIKAADADIAVSMNWLTLIPEKVMKLFPYGILNAHCGDLPKYKGNACPNWAIIKGEKEFAITIHFMAEELDSGDIVIKKYYPITEDINITDIYQIAEQEIPQLFVLAIDKIQKSGGGSPQSDRPEDKLRCYPRIPTDSLIDWSWSCDEISKVVRASAKPFSGAYTFYNDIKLHIMKCTKKAYEYPCYVYPGQVIAVDRRNGTVEIAAGDGIIVVEKIVINDEEYQAADILKSTRIRLNYCLQEEIYGLKKQITELKEQIEALNQSGK
jgi:methionyl-tRNA formyltransferase